MPSLKQAICQRENGASPRCPCTALVRQRLCEALRRCRSAWVEWRQGALVLLDTGAGRRRQRLDRLPQCFALPTLAGFAVKRTVESVQRIGQRHEARSHVGQRFRLLPRPGIQRLASGLRVVGLAGATQVVEQAARGRAGLECALHCGLPSCVQPQSEAGEGGWAKIRVLSCQSHSTGCSAGTAVTAGCSTGGGARFGLSATFRLRSSSVVRSSRSSTVFHQTTSTAGNCNAPLRVGISASRCSRLPTRPAPLTSLARIG